MLTHLLKLAEIYGVILILHAIRGLILSLLWNQIGMGLPQMSWFAGVCIVIILFDILPKNHPQIVLASNERTTEDI